MSSFCPRLGLLVAIWMKLQAKIVLFWFLVLVVFVKVELALHFIPSLRPRSCAAVAKAILLLLSCVAGCHIKSNFKDNIYLASCIF